MPDRQRTRLSLVDSETGSVVPLASDRLGQAKRPFTTRRVDMKRCKTLIVSRGPKSGDLVLAEVVSVGHHTRLDSPEGRRRTLFPGDEIILAYGARYASDQFDAIVPNDLGPCALIASGGLAGRVVRRHSKTRQPTRIAPIGLIGDETGRPVNLADFALPPAKPPSGRTPITIAVVGTAMNAGKTSAAGALVRGLAAAGLRVGAAKVSGTGSGNDMWLMVDSGARISLDFTDMGYASTHLIGQERLQTLANDLLDHLGAAQLDFVVLEIADGLLMADTADLITSRPFRDRIDSIIFAAGDSMGALAGVKWLQSHHLPVRALTGLITASPLASEEASRATGLPSVKLGELAHPEFAPQLCLQIAPRQGLA